MFFYRTETSSNYNFLAGDNCNCFVRKTFIFTYFDKLWPNIIAVLNCKADFDIVLFRFEDKNCPKSVKTSVLVKITYIRHEFWWKTFKIEKKTIWTENVKATFLSRHEIWVVNPCPRSALSNHIVPCRHMCHFGGDNVFTIETNML